MTELEALGIAHDVASKLEVWAGTSLEPLVAALLTAVATEREACAKVCISECEAWKGKDSDTLTVAGRLCASGIRKRPNVEVRGPRSEADQSPAGSRSPAP